MIDPKTEQLADTGDPRIWAYWFVQMAHKHPEMATNQSAMSSWFSRAMAAHEKKLLNDAYGPNRIEVLIKNEESLGQRNDYAR